MDRIDAAALDRHITGNYGEDSVPDELCPDCGETLDDPRTHCEDCAACAGDWHETWCPQDPDNTPNDD
jgi:uncharacterized OB-fold protein